MGVCFEQKDIFPSIQKAIERLCKLNGVANHEVIIDELLSDPEASRIIDRAIQRCPQFKRRAMAGNMIAWLSQRYSSRPGDLNEFSHRFERHKQGDGNFAYRFAK